MKVSSAFELLVMCLTQIVVYQSLSKTLFSKERDAHIKH
jgi:hypothetical protein